MYRSNPGDSRCHYQLLLCSASAATELTCRSSRNTSSTRWTVNTVYIAHDTIKAYSEGLWVQHFLYPAEKFTRTPHPTPAPKAHQTGNRWRHTTTSSVCLITQADCASFPSYNGRWSSLRRRSPSPAYGTVSLLTSSLHHLWHFSGNVWKP